MSVQELLALYRCQDHPTCPICRKIVLRYERSLNLSDADRLHMQKCILQNP
ncbi:MAG TPA: hypothetical protein PKO06_21000 [Candidatus Ozemobacteraceae bacterium]|nr:hypothetical protein [Candidatus Ozemobacteraceae bacterium]